MSNKTVEAEVLNIHPTVEVKSLGDAWMLIDEQGDRVNGSLYRTEADATQAANSFLGPEDRRPTGQIPCLPASADSEIVKVYWDTYRKVDGINSIQNAFDRALATDHVRLEDWTRVADDAAPEADWSE